MRKLSCLLGTTAFCLLPMGLLPPMAHGIVPELPEKQGAIQSVSAPQLAVAPSPMHLDANAKARHLGDFLAKHSAAWEVTWDVRSDRPLLVQGAGVPLFSGKGNRLKTAVPSEVTDIADLLKGFVADNASLLKTADLDLRFNAEGSSVYEGYFWNVEFQHFYQGVPVEGAKVFFRVNHGNIIQFGSKLVSAVRIDPTPNLTAGDALEQVLIETGLFAEQVSELRNPGTLKIYPRLLDGEEPARAYKGPAGRGYGHLLGWELIFKVEGDPTTYQAIVDAHSGRLVRLLDLNYYAAVQGGVLPATTTDTEVTEPFPFCEVTDAGGTKITDAAGNYTYDGGTATVTLDGRYINIDDNCGSI